MQINETKSGPVQGVGAGKMRAVVDCENRLDADSTAAREMASAYVLRVGFSGAGMCEQPIIGPIGPDGEMLEGHEMLDPNIDTQGFRAEFLFAQRP